LWDLKDREALARYPLQQVHARLDREEMTSLDNHGRYGDQPLAIALQEPQRALVQFVVATIKSN